MRTRSSAKKRVKFTGSGKIRLQKSSKSHLLINKSKRQKKLMPGGKETSRGNEVNIRLMMPYGK
ncbi:50S ribosomal protein L35 [Patescibacteria group bacterium]|nr:50S ribosomal protein L35 [Patescibacteria group bacterium]MBU1703483.1 50S ribosomal protein L35 [Patescibacteria group bacterium]MBU1953703.1 50S ribosomal protein L35 [Patescibacteria group bacterium]